MGAEGGQDASRPTPRLLDAQTDQCRPTCPAPAQAPGPRKLVAATWPRPPREFPTSGCAGLNPTTSADQLRKQVKSALQATLSQDQVGSEVSRLLGLQ